jgi:hypothetical protein
MCGPDCDGHPTNLNGKWVAKEQPTAVQHFHFNAFVKAKISQTPPFSLAEQRPIDAEDFSPHLARQIVELHAALTPKTVLVAIDYH